MVNDEKKVLVGVRVSRKFAAAFAQVHAAFRTSPEEIEEAKIIARSNMVAAEDAYYATAAMLDAGWNPEREQAVAFMKRTGYKPDPRWPIAPSESIDVQWKRAA